MPPYEIELRLAIRQHNTALLSFVTAELISVTTFCEVGIKTPDEARAASCLSLARTAFDEATRVAATIQMTSAQRKRFAARHSYADAQLRELSEHLYDLAGSCEVSGE